MEKYLGTVQKRIGLVISFVGIFVVLTNFINGIHKSDIYSSFFDITVWLLLIFVIPFLFSIFIESGFLKVLQVIFLFITGIISMLQDYEDFYGPGMFLVSWLLMRQYGFLDRNRIPKNIIILVALVGVSQISANINTAEGAYAGFSTLWYALFLSLMLIIIWRDMIIKQEELKKENHSLKINYIELKSQLDEIEIKKKPYDLKAANISPAEERVIRILTVYKASNREIAERLDIAESTVKLHLYNIYNKIGVDNRFAIIDLCKYNFQ